jgi:hypothetical protein
MFCAERQALITAMDDAWYAFEKLAISGVGKKDEVTSAYNRATAASAGLKKHLESCTACQRSAA